MRARAASPHTVASTRASRGTRIGAVGALVAIGVLFAGCNDDGRNLRDPRPDQVGSVSTLAPPTTTVLDPNFPDQEFPLDDQLGSVDGLPVGSGDIALPVGSGDIVPAVDEAQAPWVGGGEIQPRFTCSDLDLSPALTWTPAPTGTVEIAVTLVDNDAPTFVHWVMSGIDPFATSLGEGLVPEFATVGINGNGEPGYAGPCPPPGETHTYVYTVHFLDQQTELPDGSPGADLQAFVNGATFASLSVVGTYSQG